MLIEPTGQPPNSTGFQEFDGLATLSPDGAPPQVREDEPDAFELEHQQCTIFEMGVAAGYGDAEPGRLPGCRGDLALNCGWQQRRATTASHGYRPAADRTGCDAATDSTACHTRLGGLDRGGAHPRPRRARLRPGRSVRALTALVRRGPPHAWARATRRTWVFRS